MDPLSKPALRQRYRHLRQQIDLVEISTRICRALAERIPSSGLVLTYLATSEEVNLDPLLQAHPELSWGIPRCLPQHRLSWHDYAQSSCHISPYGIREPHPQDPQVDPQQAVLVLIPALACDKLGTRLGYGGGYYDRFLSTITAPKWAIIPHVCLCGDPLPRDPWDQSLDGIQTEQEFIPIKPDLLEP